MNSRLTMLVALSSIALFGASAPDRAEVVTANGASASLSIVDTATGAIRSLQLPLHPHNVQSSEDGSLLFVTGMADDMSGSLLVLRRSGATFKLRNTIPIGEHPAHVVADGQGRFAYVTVTNENRVKVVDLSRGQVVAAIVVGASPHGLRMSRDGRAIFVANMSSGDVSQIDVAQRREIRRFRVGRRPVQVAVSPDARRVYVTLADDDAVAAIDLRTQHVFATVRVGRNPAQCFLSPDATRLYVANQGSAAIPGRTVTVVETGVMRVIDTIQVGQGPHGVVLSADGTRAFVTNVYSDDLFTLQTKPLHVLNDYHVGQAPNGVTVVPPLPRFGTHPPSRRL